MSQNNSARVQQNNKNLGYFINRQIRSPKVLLIDSENKNRGVVPIYDALNAALEVGLDLVQINAPNAQNNVPTCKILDFGKFKYEQSKKEKAAKKKQKESIIKIKEIKFRPNTDDNDLKTKARQAQEFLNEGCQIKISIVFKGREINYVDIGKDTLRYFMELVPEMTLISEPIVTGKQLTVTVAKSK